MVAALRRHGPALGPSLRPAQGQARPGHLDQHRAAAGGPDAPGHDGQGESDRLRTLVLYRPPCRLPFGPSLSVVLGPSLSVILGPSLSVILGPSLSVILGPSLSVILGPSLSVILGPSLSVILGPSLSVVLGPSLSVILGRDPRIDFRQREAGGSGSAAARAEPDPCRVAAPAWVNVSDVRYWLAPCAAWSARSAPVRAGRAGGTRYCYKTT